MLVDLGIQHAMRMRYTVICGLYDSTNLSTLSYKGKDFRKKKVFECKMRALIFSTLFCETFLILRIIMRDMIIDIQCLCIKYALFLSDFNL